MLTALEYIQLFTTCVVEKNKYPVIDRVIDQMTPNRKVYEFISKAVKNGESYVRSNQFMAMPDTRLLQAMGYGNICFRTNFFSNNKEDLFHVPASAKGSMPDMPYAASGLMAAPIASQPLVAQSNLSTNITATNVLQQVIRVPRAIKNGSSGAEIPWYVIGLIHYIECNFSFQKHLHNGDSLARKTWRYPAGRPLSNDVGNPPYSFVESALDALTCEPNLRFEAQATWCLPVLLYNLEKYNGLGYQKHTPPLYSPYLWSFSNHYEKGKFIEKKVNGKVKSVFMENLVSQQVGLAVILKRMEDRNLISIPRT